MRHSSVHTHSERVVRDGKSVISNAGGIHNPKSVALTLSDIDAGPRHLRAANIAPNPVDHGRIRDAFEIVRIIYGEIGCSGLNNYLVHGGI